MCPEARDVPGVLTGQTGNDPDNPKCWMEWPTIRNGNGFTPTTIPERGFEKILKVAYWINASNPIGGTTQVVQDEFYTASVGYGPGSNGLTFKPTRTSAFVRPSTLIAVADGIYSGRQRDNRIGAKTVVSPFGIPAATGPPTRSSPMATCRRIEGTRFPRAFGAGNDPQEVIKRAVTASRRSTPILIARSGSNATQRPPAPETNAPGAG